MILIDTGPLVAMIDKDDDNHAACLAKARKLPAVPLLTTWPCFTETMYLLGETGGYRYQALLWSLVNSRRLILHICTQEEILVMEKLMQKYQDIPMDLADASLMAVAEHLKISRIFTIDSDFQIYRLKNGDYLNVI